jgi:CBS domain containing-hemolysin-like protein
LFFGEILPKIFATKFSLYFGMLFAPVIYFLSYMFFPIVWVLESIIKLLNKLVKSNEDRVSKDIVSMFVEDWEKQGILSNTESRIIKNLLDFNEKTVENILQHRTKIFALDWNMNLKNAIKEISKKTYSRIPVFSEDKDNIIWTITIRDIINLINEKKDLNTKLINLSLNKIFKIPLTASVFDIFLKMKKSWQHFSIVLDEQWWTAWIVTFEDVLEELVW